MDRKIKTNYLIMNYLFFLLFISTFSYAQEKISLETIALYEGKTVTVCEKVQSTYLSKNNKTIMLNFGKPYPNQTFVVVVFEKDFPNFSYSPAVFLKNKTICITGTVVIYNGMPEIIVKNEKEIIIQ